MPLPLAPVIAGGASLLGQGLSAYAMGKTNKKQRKWNEKMYALQRKDALADWQMQADYNSPAMQMERYKAAGLNPNLIYGQMTEAAPVRSTDVKGWQPQSPQFDLGGAVAQYQDTKVQQMNMDTIEKQQKLLDQELLNKQAMEFKIWADTHFTGSKKYGQDVTNKYLAQIKETGLQSMQARIANVNKSTEMLDANWYLRREALDLQVKRYELDQLKAGQSMEESAQRILNMRERALGYQIERTQKLEQTTKTAFEIKNLISQKQVLEEAIENLRSRTKLTDEQRRLLESTPDWGDQRAIQSLQDILQSVIPKNNIKRMY